MLKQVLHQWRTQEFCSGGGLTNSVEDRENGDLGVPLNLQMSEPRIIIRLLRMYFSTELGIRLSVDKTS
jgi:hypothetical protein